MFMTATAGAARLSLRTVTHSVRAVGSGWLREHASPGGATSEEEGA